MIDWQLMTALAVKGLDPEQARRVAKALDIAIAFGALEHANGNESLQNIARVTAEADRKFAELKFMR